MRQEQIHVRGRARAIPVASAFFGAALAVSGMAHAARPVPSLNAAVCAALSGQWASPTCTIPEGTNGVASSDFRITKASALDVKGGLTINAGVTIANAGAITIANTAGVTPSEFGDGLAAGILVLGTLDNAGSITIQNVTDGTVGIATSVSVAPSDPMVPNPFQVTPGVLANAGLIAIHNTGSSQGINNLGALTNSATGTITVANGLTGGSGIRNRRDVSLGSQYYVVGTLTNAGALTIANSADGPSRGISNSGSFTNAATGTFAIAASEVSDPLSYGFRNNGTFTNFGAFINNRGSLNDASFPDSTWGTYNIGTMINYGKTSVGAESARSGTFYNEGVMLNLGDITSYGALFDNSGYMVNYATFYNFGLIVGGANLGVCLDEPGSQGGC